MAVEAKQIDGLSFSITGLENSYDIERSIYSALSLATLNLNKVGNYSLLIKSDGHHDLRITTDAPRDVIEPIIADLREKTVRGMDADGSPEYVGDISGLEKATLTSYTLPNLTGTVRTTMRNALWLKDMRTGGKNQQFTGIRAGVDGSGLARALFRADDTDVATYMYNTFDEINTRQGVVDAVREQTDAALESSLKNQLPPEAYREYAKYEKWGDDIVLRNGKIKEIKQAIKTASPKEAVRMQKRMDILQRKNALDRRRLKRARTRVDDNILTYTNDLGGMQERINGLLNKKRVSTEDKARALGLMKKRDVISARVQREEQRRIRLASYEPGTPQYQSRIIRGMVAGDTTSKIRKQWVKDNPDSEVAKKLKKADRKRTGAALRSITGQVVRGILVAAGVIVGLLAKLYLAVTDIGKNVAKQSAAALGFNMPYEEMQGLNRFAGSRTGLDPDVFSKMFTKVTASFSDPASLDTAAIGQLAPYLGTTTVRLTDFITRNTDRPDTIAYAIINKLMQNTASGIGGVQSGLESDEAFARNKKVLSDFDPSFADMFAEWYQWLRIEERNGRTTLRQGANTGIYTGFIEPLIPEGASTSSSTYDAALETQKNLDTFIGNLKALKDDVLTKILAHMGDLVALVRNFVMKWFDDHNLFPEYVAAESAAAAASNAQGVTELTAWRDDLQPAVQEYADKYGRGTTPEARVTDFLDRMEEVQNGNIRALPENMSMAEFYDIYGGIVSYYQALLNKLKEFEAAYDPKSGLTMFVNWSRDYINNTASGMSHSALRKTRNIADSTIEYLESGIESGVDRAFYDNVNTAIKTVDVDMMRVRQGHPIAIARVLDIDRELVTGSPQEDLKVYQEQAVVKLASDKTLLERARDIIGPEGTGLAGILSLTAAERGHLDILFDRYSGAAATAGSFRTGDVPRGHKEAAAIAERLNYLTEARAAFERIGAEINQWVDENGLSASHYLDQGWTAYANTDSAQDLTITIKLVDPEGKEKVITTSLPKTDRRVDLGTVPVTGVLGNDISTFTEAYSRR
jgi:hypothetical protein